MDPISIAPLALSAWNILVPFIKKLAGKMMEKAGEALPEVAGKIWDTVKEKMEAQPQTQTLPAELVAAPEDEDLQGAFKYQLKKLLENDEAFAKQLDGLVKQAEKQGDTYKASLKGSGAVAQGAGAMAVGKGGVISTGAVRGDIVTGTKKTTHKGKSKK
jgi:hypothetical protein